MQIVIDIDKKEYEEALRGYFNVIAFNEAVKHSTPLPKGHGRLIDTDELTKEIKSYIRDTSNLHYDDLVEAEAYNSAYYNCLDEIEYAPTIIEADKSESEG